MRDKNSVKTLWSIAIRDELEEFPRHFFNLCSLSPSLSRLGFLSLIPPSFSWEKCFPLQTHFSFFLHSFGHSYLHSSLGTFGKYLDHLFLQNDKNCCFESEKLHSFENIFLRMLDVVLYSSFEIREKFSVVYNEVLLRVPEWCRVPFFLRSFFLDFVCCGLEQPMVFFLFFFSFFFFFSFLIPLSPFPLSPFPHHSRKLFLSPFPQRQKLCGLKCPNF